jgi:hypothetical protein
VGLSDAQLGSLVRNGSADLHVKEPKEDTSPIVLAAQTRPSFTVGLALEGEGRRECRVKASPMARQQ